MSFEKKMKYIIYLLIIFSFFGCSKKQETKKTEPAGPEQEIEQFSVADAKGGKLHWSLTANSAQILEVQKTVLLEMPKIKFFEEGKYVSTLVSSKGKINMDNYDFFADSSCVLSTAKGETLETRNLRYDSGKKKIFTNDKIKLTRPGELIYGDGLEATPDLEVIKITNQKLIVLDEKEQKK
jgi:LPS export ABC transporter protein LptC